jgi:hypothetical protein
MGLTPNEQGILQAVDQHSGRVELHLDGLPSTRVGEQQLDDALSFSAAILLLKLTSQHEQNVSGKPIGASNVHHLEYFPSIVLQSLQSVEILVGNPAPDTNGWDSLQLKVLVFPLDHGFASSWLDCCILEGDQHRENGISSCFHPILAQMTHWRIGHL